MNDFAKQQFLSVTDLAERYGLTPPTIYAWLHNGTAPMSLKIGRRRMFRLTDVLSWEQQRENKDQTGEVA